MKTYLLSILLISVTGIFSIAQKANNEEIKLIIERHNFYRNEVGVSNIVYSDKLADVALSWAKSLKQKCQFEHSSNSYGENLFKGTVGYYTAGDAVTSWGEEKVDYNYAQNTCDKGKVCGHYTQIVWNNTTEVGCAKMICDGMVTWVCNYNPPGNYVGQKPY